MTEQCQKRTHAVQQNHRFFAIIVARWLLLRVRAAERRIIRVLIPEGLLETAQI